VALKDPKTWKVAGKPVKRLDTAPKLTGAQRYGIDLKLPGMLSAAIKDCPIVGGKLKSYDVAAIQGKPGVKKVLRVGDSAVAVVADTWWRAKTALDALPIEWDEGPNAKLSSADIAATLKEGLDAKEAFIGNESGNARTALAAAARRIEAVYSYPYQNHATMEPMNSTARWTAERCEVLTPTQNCDSARAATSEASGLPAAKCDVYKQLLGGGFGRRGQTDWIRQTVAIAKEMPGTPIKLVWTRKRTCSTVHHPITQSSSAPASTPRATSRLGTCGSRASRSSPASSRRTCRTAATR
jgi:isoquinoline 1-oxidoreductase beta subunit